MYSFTTTSDPAMARAFVESLRPRVLKLTGRGRDGDDAPNFVTAAQFNAVPGEDMEMIEYVPDTFPQRWGDEWPDDQPRRYNGSGTPCDMWNGPCCCGAWHVKGI